MSILDRLIGLFRNDPERNRKRGAENARRFLAGNPTREEIELFGLMICWYVKIMSSAETGRPSLHFAAALSWYVTT